MSKQRNVQFEPDHILDLTRRYRGLIEMSAVSQEWPAIDRLALLSPTYKGRGSKYCVILKDLPIQNLSWYFSAEKLGQHLYAGWKKCYFGYCIPNNLNILGGERMLMWYDETKMTCVGAVIVHEGLQDKMNELKMGKHDQKGEEKLLQLLQCDCGDKTTCTIKLRNIERQPYKENEDVVVVGENPQPMIYEDKQRKCIHIEDPNELPTRISPTSRGTLYYGAIKKKPLFK